MHMRTHTPSASFVVVSVFDGVGSITVVKASFTKTSGSSVMGWEMTQGWTTC